MMMESQQARVFCVRLIHKLSEVFTGMKVGHVMPVSCMCLIIFLRQQGCMI